MEDKIKALTDELETSRFKEVEVASHLAELKAADAKKVTAKHDAGAKPGAVKNKTFRSAKAARELAETTYAFRNRIAKLINEVAKEGMTQVIYCVDDICDVQVNAVITELSDLGYDVNLSDETQELTIKW